MGKFQSITVYDLSLFGVHEILLPSTGGGTIQFL